MDLARTLNEAWFAIQASWLDQPSSGCPAVPVWHAACRDDLCAQLLDGRTMTHGSLPDQRESVLFGQRVGAHQLEHRGKHHASGADAIFQFLDVGRFFAS